MPDTDKPTGDAPAAKEKKENPVMKFLSTVLKPVDSMFDGLLKIPPTLHPVGAGDADEERQGVRPGLPYRFGCLEGETEAILQGAAIPVFPVVG